MRRNGNSVSIEWHYESQEVTIPDWVIDQESFRRWAEADDFPETARICWLRGRVWIDMSREQIYTHNDVEKGPTRPVQYVTATEAYCFARCLECQLPRWEQWDRAGGRYDGDPGPAVWRDGDGEEDNRGIAVKLNQSLPVESTTRDESRYGCRNMAGNGYEWTRSVVDATGVARVVPLSNPRNTDTIIRRGQNYTADNQLLFNEEDLPAPCRYFETREGFSFRVVLEIPVGELKGK